MAQEAKVARQRVFIATPVPGRPGGNRTISPFLLVDYANRMRDVAARKAPCSSICTRPCSPTCTATSASTDSTRTRPGTRRIAELFFQAIQANLEVR